MAGTTRSVGNGTGMAGDTVWGDFNGDGMKEFLWVTGAWDSVQHCKQNCTCRILCSDKRFPVLDTRHEIWEGTLMNEGDLDGDGADDVSLAGFNEGSWGICYVYTFRKGRWREGVPPFPIWDGLGERNIEKDPARKGYVIIREWFCSDSIYVKARTVKIR
jgi:hypothetical protein